MPTWSMVVKSSAGRPVRGSVVTAASSRKTSETTGAGATQSRGAAAHTGAAGPRVGRQAWLQGDPVLPLEDPSPPPLAGARRVPARGRSGLGEETGRGRRRASGRDLARPRERGGQV